jgi:two-component system OmpR family sensor kinase
MVLTPTEREFIKAASHGLLNPLTLCRGHLELLRHDPDQLSDALALVIGELDRMAGIIKGLELLVEAEEPDFVRNEKIDSELFTHELLAKASALAPRRWLVDDIAAERLFADPQLLTEAVMQLADNAVHHTVEADTIAVGTSVSGDEVRVWVRNTGERISAADQARIFERFTRGEDAHLGYRGSGLGLAIVRAIAEAHGGRVEFESHLERGSTFTILLPRRLNDATSEGSAS